MNGAGSGGDAAGDTLTTIENLIGIVAGRHAHRRRATTTRSTAATATTRSTAAPATTLLTGGNGIDRVSYAGAASAVTVSLAVTTAQTTGGSGTDTLATFENLTGSASGDTLDRIVDEQRDRRRRRRRHDRRWRRRRRPDGWQRDRPRLLREVRPRAWSSNLSLTVAGQATGDGTDTLATFENVTGSTYDDTLTGNANPERDRRRRRQRRDPGRRRQRRAHRRQRDGHGVVRELDGRRQREPDDRGSLGRRDRHGRDVRERHGLGQGRHDQRRRRRQRHQGRPRQ